MAKLSPLGRGLEELFVDNSTDNFEKVSHINIELIIPDKDQHRKHFDETAINELSESIKIHGVIQPILLKPKGEKYQIIAGERRYRASLAAGLAQIPAIIKDLSDIQAAEVALIENLQREDLNPIEEAKGLHSLVENFGLTQEEAAKRVGKSRSSFTNALRLLSLPVSAQSLLKDGNLSVGHAKVLLAIKDEKLLNDLLCEIISKDLSVRETEAAIRKLLGKKQAIKPDNKETVDEVTLSHFKELEEKASSTLGRKVKLAPDKSGNGHITLEYFDSDDLEEILGLLCGEEFFI